MILQTKNFWHTHFKWRVWDLPSESKDRKISGRATKATKESQKSSIFSVNKDFKIKTTVCTNLDPETEAAEWNSLILNLIIYTSVFISMTPQEIFLWKLLLSLLMQTRRSWRAALTVWLWHQSIWEAFRFNTIHGKSWRKVRLFAAFSKRYNHCVLLAYHYSEIRDAPKINKTSI